jgi:hypothetical protein
LLFFFLLGPFVILNLPSTVAAVLWSAPRDCPQNHKQEAML